MSWHNPFFLWQVLRIHSYTVDLIATLIQAVSHIAIFPLVYRFQNTESAMFQPGCLYYKDGLNIH